MIEVALGKIVRFVLILCLLSSGTLLAQEGAAVTILGDASSAPVRFGMQHLDRALRGADFPVRLVDVSLLDSSSGKRIVLADVSEMSVLSLLSDREIDLPDLPAEAFAWRRLRTSRGVEYWVLGGDETGVMYGAIELAESVTARSSLIEFEAKEVVPRFPVRALKHNLPWSSYRVHESINLHYSTCRDLGYWRRLLDMMAVSRLNTLTLWSLHPWPFMVRSKSHPEATIFMEEEMEEWRIFWQRLFRLAQDRGVDVFMVNWNIWVSPKYALLNNAGHYNITRHYNGPGDYSEEVQRYNQESVVQVLEEYPDLTGIAVSANERMGGVSDQEMEDWIVETYFGALDQVERPVEFMHRGHTHPDPAITRRAIESNAHRLPDPVWVPLKFNWSHGHATPDLVYIHGGSDSDVWWEPMPENYKLVWTIRNEDFFVLRWGQPDFVRAMIEQNGQEYVGGFQIGSETYLPAREYITKAGPHLSWDYGFEKQWLFYLVWGRLLYDPETPDLTFERAFDRRYGPGRGRALLAGHKKAGNMPLRLASLYSATWDFTLYSEGFLSGYYPWRGGYYDDYSPFISIDELIDNPPLDPDYLSIRKFVALEQAGTEIEDDQVTPPELADLLEADGRRALAEMDSLHDEKDPTLLHEIADVRAWAHLSLYFAEKIRAGVDLEKARREIEAEGRVRARRHLETALEHWDRLIEVTEPYSRPFPLLHFGDDFFSWTFEKPMTHFSWAGLRDQVLRDLDLVDQPTPR